MKTLLATLMILTGSTALAHGGKQHGADGGEHHARTEKQGAAKAKVKVKVVEITVDEKGYSPSPLTLTKGEPVTLRLTRTSDKTCATEFVLDDPAVKADLPLNKPVEVVFIPKKSGTLKYGCAMDKMVSGTFVVQ